MSAQRLDDGLPGVGDISRLWEVRSGRAKTPSNIKNPSRNLSLYFSIYYPHLYLEITPPDPTLHLIPGTILKGIDAN